MGLIKQGVQVFISSLLKHSFHKLSLTLLTLLLPLSFLLLARLTSPSPQHPIAHSSTLVSILLRVGPPLIHLLVSFASAVALLHALTGHLLRPATSVVWAILCLFQACITLGVEATIVTGTRPARSKAASCATWIESAVFLAGLYETMLLWSRMFVRPVVDDTIFGAVLKEGRIERVAIGAAFSMLWLWVLRDEVGPLVSAAGVEALANEIGWGGFVRRLVSYATVMTGMVRIVEVLAWVGKHLLLPCGEADEASVDYAPPLAMGTQCSVAKHSAWVAKFIKGTAAINKFRLRLGARTSRRNGVLII